MATEHDHHHHGHGPSDSGPHGQSHHGAGAAHEAHDHGACAHAAHQSERAGSAIARAEAACQAQGVRLTPIRRQVLEALYTTHRPLGAYDLVAMLGHTAEPKGRPLAPVTIYRALDFLMEQGLAHRLASRNAFIACPHGHGPSDLVAFLICEECGGVDERASAPLSQAVAGLLAGERFQAQRQVLEISGRCGHCREAASS
jgi:Fur family zinc uptake transcriptional regulator